MSSHVPSVLFAAAEKLGRKIRINADEIVWVDDQPAPSAEAWEAAIQTILTRKVISAAEFAALFTEEEKQEIFRRASLSKTTSPTSPQFARLQYRFMQLTHVRSDAQELVDVLNLLEQTGVITNARRLRIAAFLPPEA